jgi:cytidylate kinase
MSVAEGLLKAFSAPAGGAVAVADRGTGIQKAHFAVAISREAGAGGVSVAREVARRLGCPMYDREVLEKIAEEMRRPKSEVAALDERPVGWLEELFAGMLHESRVTGDTYVKYLVGALRGLVLMGPCVIVGRGSSCVLPPETTLRVRLVASLPDRIRTARHRFGMTEREAAAWVYRTDEERARFLKRYFRVDSADPHLHDIVLNTSRLSSEECADVIVRAYRRFEAERSPLARPE